MAEARDEAHVLLVGAAEIENGQAGGIADVGEELFEAAASACADDGIGAAPAYCAEMERTISGFHKDDAGDWVAELSCGHGQHIRHKPPFQLAPWVLDDAQRAGRVGSVLNCPLCDRGE